MPTQEERRNAFLEFHASDCWESRRRELVAIIFPDEPAPKHVTLNIQQKFAEGTTPDQVAQSIKESVEQAKRPPERPEWVQPKVMLAIRIQVLNEICDLLRDRGKNKSARYIEHHFLLVPVVVPYNDPPEDQHR